MPRRIRRPRRRGGIHAARDSHPARMSGPAFMPPAVRIRTDAWPGISGGRRWRNGPRPAATKGTVFVDGARGNRGAIAPGTGNRTDRGGMVDPSRRGRARVGAWMPAAPGTCADRRGGIHAARDSHRTPMPGPAFMPPAIRIAHQCPARHSCRPPFPSRTNAGTAFMPFAARRSAHHAARVPHPAPMPGRPRSWLHRRPVMGAFQSGRPRPLGVGRQERAPLGVTGRFRRAS